MFRVLKNKMQNPKSKTFTVALTAIYCAFIGAGIIWQNSKINGVKLTSNILNSEVSDLDSTSSDSSTATERSTTLKRLAVTTTNPDTQSVIRPKIDEEINELKETRKEVKPVWDEAEWCKENPVECESEKVARPPQLQDLKNKVKEEEEYQKYLQAIEMITQMEEAAIEAEIKAKEAEVEFMNKNEVFPPENIATQIENLKSRVENIVQKATDTKNQLRKVAKSKTTIASTTGVTTNKPKETILNPIIITKKSNENKIIISRSQKNNSLLSANILSTDSTKTVARPQQ